MKLNLLPTYVSKEKQSKTAWVLSLLIAVVAIVFSVGLMTSSAKALADQLNAGALPVPLEQQELVNVEATLGRTAEVDGQDWRERQAGRFAQAF